VELNGVLQGRRSLLEVRSPRIVPNSKKEKTQKPVPVQLTPKEKEDLQLRRAAIAQRQRVDAANAENRAAQTAELRRRLERRRAFVSPATSKMPGNVATERRRFLSPLSAAQNKKNFGGKSRGRLASARPRPRCTSPQPSRAREARTDVSSSSGDGSKVVVEQPCPVRATVKGA